MLCSFSPPFFIDFKCIFSHSVCVLSKLSSFYEIFRLCIYYAQIKSVVTIITYCIPFIRVAPNRACIRCKFNNGFECVGGRETEN